jgi:tRNA(fMet)-specific endonuclease VapC
MSNLLIDSSIIIDYLRQKDKSETLLALLLKTGYQSSISIVTVVESYAGKSVWESSQIKAVIDELLAGMEIFGLDIALAQQSGQIRAKYNLSTMDAIIAATAIEHNLPLATLNTKDFDKVPDLKINKV